MFFLGQGNAADIHAQEAGNDVDGQCQETAQANINAAQGTEGAALCDGTFRQQAIFNLIDMRYRAAGDLLQPIGLIPQQVGEQGCRRPEALAGLYRNPQAINAAQRMQAGTDDLAVAHTHAQRGNLRRFVGKIIKEVIEDGDQTIVGLLDHWSRATI